MWYLYTLNLNVHVKIFFDNLKILKFGMFGVYIKMDSSVMCKIHFANLSLMKIVRLTVKINSKFVTVVNFVVTVVTF
jgi:hypothetical protein